MFTVPCVRWWRRRPDNLRRDFRPAGVAIEQPNKQRENEMADDGTGMFEVLDALESALKSADSCKLTHLAKTLESYSRDFRLLVVPLLLERVINRASFGRPVSGAAGVLRIGR